MRGGGPPTRPLPLAPSSQSQRAEALGKRVEGKSREANARRLCICLFRSQPVLRRVCLFVCSFVWNGRPICLFVCLRTFNTASTIAGTNGSIAFGARFATPIIITRACDSLQVFAFPVPSLAFSAPLSDPRNAVLLFYIVCREPSVAYSCDAILSSN